MTILGSTVQLPATELFFDGFSQVAALFCELGMIKVSLC